ncbi:esterase-like activity of phytase family protein [Roseateles amylovorans]|uniref:Esterase-like activity of phytase family protein n=1 Tax=Roseateles amylovorans TaxID=2978473 RepID=A0ABY6AZL8_9BURK|nr:esterase-like activity of phytase family protein [Roseateles amylovorans]UXH78402.1 esterase-like activity of phytase family protein [Roseateles amylovorans]
MRRFSSATVRTAPPALLALSAALLAGCGGDGNTNQTPSPAVIQARLLDGPVEGVSFSASPSATVGKTAAGGVLSCKTGDTVSFSVGGIALGTAACTPNIAVSDLAGTNTLTDAPLQNRLVFLQTLDEDDDPSNGIRIPAAVADTLAGKTLDFAAAATAFDTALASLLPAAQTDAYGQPYSARAMSATRRGAAVEHYEATLAAYLGKTGTSSSAQDSAGGTVTITKFQVQATDSQYVPYEGGNAGAKKDFPKGFFPAVGSGLVYKGRNADGAMEFWGITDRGPNGDSPMAPRPDTGAVVATKMFPSPSFTPSIGVVTLGAQGAVISSLTPIKSEAGARISGRPLPFGAVGSSAEVPLNDSLKYDGDKAGFDAQGLDSETLVYDAAAKVFWTSDEYGPFIVKIDAATGQILKRYAPGSTAGSLPEVLKHRRPNRGMEGLALDTATGKLHGFLQSPIDPVDTAGKSVEVVDSSDLDQDGKNTDKVKVRDFAQFARWIEFDPKTETSRLYAYPLSYPLAAKGEKWDRNRTGSAKLGDLVSLGGGKFIVIEQGADASGAVRNFLMLVEVPAAATDIAAIGIDLEKNSIDGSTAAATTWANVVKLKKTVLLDLNAAGWKAEKAEGLALVDTQTLALINDNDFGLRTSLVDAAGKPIAGDPTECSVDVNGVIASNGACTAGAVGVRVTRGSEIDRTTRLWLLKFPKALTGFSVP